MSTQLFVCGHALVCRSMQRKFSVIPLSQRTCGLSQRSHSNESGILFINSRLVIGVHFGTSRPACKLNGHQVYGTQSHQHLNVTTWLETMAQHSYSPHRFCISAPMCPPVTATIQRTPLKGLKGFLWVKKIELYFIIIKLIPAKMLNLLPSSKALSFWSKLSVRFPWHSILSMKALRVPQIPYQIYRTMALCCIIYSSQPPALLHGNAGRRATTYPSFGQLGE